MGIVASVACDAGRTAGMRRGPRMVRRPSCAARYCRHLDSFVLVGVCKIGALAIPFSMTGGEL